MDYFCLLEPDNFYHIYNRTNHGIQLFYHADNYKYFLRKFDEYLSTYLETYAFCLLSNHFHFLVRVKTPTETEAAKIKPTVRIGASDVLIEPVEAVFRKEISHEKQISEMFRRLFTGYAKAINKQQHLFGNLLNHKFKRKLINNTSYFRNVVFYIHSNPEIHKISDDFRHYPWSSYKRILIDKPTKLYKKEILEWFDGKSNYVEFHNKKHDLENIQEYIIED